MKEEIDGAKIAFDTEKRLKEKHILFLENVTSIIFNDRTRKKQWMLKKVKKPDGSVELYTNLDNVEKSSNWIIYQEKLIPPKGLESKIKDAPDETKITIAIPKNINPEIINSMKQEPVYCYLPTRQQTGLPFLIQADFEPIPGRIGIAKSHLNLWLLKNLGKLAAKMISDIAQSLNSNNETFLLIPCKEDTNVDLIALVDNMHKKLSREKFVYDVDGNILTPRRCALVTEGIKNILYKTDLKRMKNKDLNFIITDSLNHEVIGLLNNLGAIGIENEDIIILLNKKKIISKRSPEWFLNVYEYLTTIFDYSLVFDDDYQGSDEEQKLFSKLLVTPFLLTDDSTLIAPRDFKNPLRIVTYQQKTDVTQIASVLDKGEWFVLHRHFQISTYIKGNDPNLDQKREEVKKFLVGLGIQKYLNHRNIIDKIIIPKLKRIKDVQKNRRQIYDLTDYIRQKHSSYKADIKKSKVNIPDDEIFDFLKENVPVLSYVPGKKKNVLKRGYEVYFPKAYGKSEKMQTLFKGIKGIYFLSPYYISRDKTFKKLGSVSPKLSWKKFFETIGVWSSPIVHITEEYVDIDWSWKNPLTSGLSGYDFQTLGDANSEDIEKLFKHINTLTSRSKLLKYKLLWESLEKNWERKYQKEVKNTTIKHFHYKKKTVERETSTFLEFLRNHSWVAGYSGKKSNLFEPKKLYLPDTTNKHLLGASKPFLAWKGRDVFIRDLQVQRSPSTDIVIRHLRNLRAKSPRTRSNILEKTETIYSFLYSEIFKKADNEKSWHLEKAVKEIILFFKKESLIYIPRKTGNHWWSPDEVFLEDFSETFGIYRGYLTEERNPLYGPQLEHFFLSLGVSKSAKISDCVKILEQFNWNKDKIGAQTIGPNVFLKIESLLEYDLGETINWDRALFCSYRGKFRKPNKIFYNNNNDIARLFEKQVEILYLPYAWNNIKNCLTTVGIMGIYDVVIKEKKIKGITSIETEIEDRISCIAETAHKYLMTRKPGTYLGDFVQHTVRILDDVRIYEADKIDIIFKLPKKAVSKPLAIRETRKVYWSLDENRLYISKEIDPFSSDVAKEMSEIFGELAGDAFPVIDSLFTCGMDEEEFIKKVKKYELSDIEISHEPALDVEIMEQEEIDVNFDLDNDDEEEEAPSMNFEIEIEEILPSPQKRKRLLINPSEYDIGTVMDLEPYKSRDGDVKRDGKEEVKTREGTPSHGGNIKLSKEMVPSKVDAESLSYMITMAYEKSRGWKPEDRHKQKTIGYDVYSKKGNTQRFIEVKYFSRKEGTFTLTEYEWAKAKEVKSKFYVYVVNGLEEGVGLSLSIIRNPFKYLVPEESSNKKIRRWDSAVCEKITFKKKSGNKKP